MWPFRHLARAAASHPAGPITGPAPARSAPSARGRGTSVRTRCRSRGSVARGSWGAPAARPGWARARARAAPPPAERAPRRRGGGDAGEAGHGGRAESPRGRAAAAAEPALGLGRRLPPEAARLGGADAAPAAATPAALDLLLRALQRCPQRPVRPLALQLAGAGRQLPRSAHGLLPLHQVPLLQGPLAGPGPAGSVLHGAQGRQPR